MKKRLSLLAAVSVLLLLSALVYTWPHTLGQWCPQFDLSTCTQVVGFYRLGATREEASFVVHPGEAHFDELVELFQVARFRLKLSNLLPRRAKTYIGDGIQWEVVFSFENTPVEDGFVSGALLGVDNFFGELSVFTYGGDRFDCSVQGQELWMKEVSRIVRLCGVEK